MKYLSLFIKTNIYKKKIDRFKFEILSKVERTDQWVENTQMVLYGHRSIVNQVRYNPQKCLLASSGVEKIVKVSYITHICMVLKS